MNTTSVSSNYTVLLPLPLGKGYTYKASKQMLLEPGDIVSVPFGAREVIGVVWDSSPEIISTEKLKTVKTKIGQFRLPIASRKFIRWVSHYNMVYEGLVLKMAISVSDAFKAPKSSIVYFLKENPSDFKRTREREAVIRKLGKGLRLPGAQLAKKAEVSESVIKGLVKLGVLGITKMSHPEPVPANPDWNLDGPKLSIEQQRAASFISDIVVKKNFETIVLEGVPGSGKTEVYMEPICKALSEGRQVLVLLPEIALSAQWLKRFESRFGCRPVLWNSDLSKKQRVLAWRSVALGTAKVVVGARSALFLPFPNIGLIIIDEEHDSSYKQEEGVIYSARDMGVVRAKIEEIPIVLTSATPSLETVLNVREGRYKYFNLPERHGGAAMPDIELVDMRRQDVEVGKWLSKDLIKGLKSTFGSGEQAMLFLNRRGYAPLTLCRACGYRFKCKQCSTWLVEHRLLNNLKCHQCGYIGKIPNECPECDTTDQMTACGPGVERIAEEVSEVFPDIRTKIITSDTIVGGNKIAALVEQVEKREIDLMIGTQMISKGHHFPYLTLVGVVDADLGLSGGDLRASEKTYQLLYQVSGRAGREERPGRVIIQTYMPDHPVMKAIGSGKRETYLSAETDDREESGMPPFGRLVAIIVSGKNQLSVQSAITSLNKNAPRDDTIKVFGPADAPLRIIRGRYRSRFLLKAPKNRNIQTRIIKWLSLGSLPNDVRIKIDIDPHNFL